MYGSCVGAEMMNVEEEIGGGRKRVLTEMMNYRGEEEEENVFSDLKVGRSETDFLIF